MKYVKTLEIKESLNTNIKNRCCNFELLEKLSIKYIK